MDLYKQILVGVLAKEEAHVTFPNLEVDAAEIIEMVSLETLKKIKAILEDDSFEDPECFMRIEAIVRAFEDTGSGCGSRHDF